MTFIKSADTKTSVADSRAQVEKMLRRYGAVGFNVQQTFTDKGLPLAVTVQFIVPDAPGSKARVPVSLPINVEHVARALFGAKRMHERRWQRGAYVTGLTEAQWQQSERVAWRNLALWIDAALSAASVGLQTITEAFYAHAVVALPHGGHARLSEVIESAQGSLPVGVRALLATPANTEAPNDR